MEGGSIKITDVKCVRTRLSSRVNPIVKIETDAGVVGIGRCHHEENGLDARDALQDDDMYFLLWWQSRNGHGAITGVESSLQAIQEAVAWHDANR